MGYSIIWIGVALVLALTLLATLNLALRIPSRTRLAEQFERQRRSAQLERFVARRAEFMMATAGLRVAATLALFWTVLHHPDVTGIETPWRAHATAFAVALALVLIFGVAIPGAWSKYSGEWLLARALPLLEVVRIACHPVVVVLGVLDPLVRRLAGVPIRDAKSYADELEREIIDTVEEMERQGVVDEDEKEMIESVIDMRDTLVQQIMTPRTEMVAIPVEADLAAAKNLIRSKGHSRIPVFEGTIDTILGVLYAKDLLQVDSATGFEMAAIMRKALFIPETKPVRNMLKEFREQKVHIALVLDEYGGTAGLVTIEDIIEELVGEITDEYEQTPEAPLKRIDEHTVEVDARMSIDDVNDELGIQLPEDEDYETIGGFVFSAMGRIPQAGEQCEHDNVAIQVVAAEPRRVTRLRLKITPKPAEDEEQA